MHPHLLVLRAAHAWWILKAGRNRKGQFGVGGPVFNVGDCVNTLVGTRTTVFEAGWRTDEVTTPSPAWICHNDLTLILRLEAANAVPALSAPTEDSLKHARSTLARITSHLLSILVFFY
jgi:hypothetical protein